MQSTLNLLSISDETLSAFILKGNSVEVQRQMVLLLSIVQVRIEAVLPTISQQKLMFSEHSDQKVQKNSPLGVALWP